MSSAERVIAFNEMFTALGHDPHTVPAEVRRVVHEAALKYARASGLRSSAGTTETKRVASGERSAVAGDGPLVRFGRDKGKPLSAVADLSWYRKALAENVADEAKARFRDQNVAHLAEVDAELERR